MFPVLLLSGCVPPWGNALRDKGNHPVDYGKIVVSLWVENTDNQDQGIGSAVLVLATGDLTCKSLEEDDWSDKLLWDESGVYVSFRWSNSPFANDDDGADIGFAGTYYQGMDVLENEKDGLTTRSFSSVLFSGGVAQLSNYYYSDDVGQADVKTYSADRVAGHIDTSDYEARFDAENCGDLVVSTDTGG